MVTGMVHGMRRLRTLLWTVFSIVVISAAVLVGLGKLLMPYSHRYQPQLEQWLSSEFGYPVTVESFSGEWRAFGPRLTLAGLRIQPGNRPAESDGMLIAEAALDLKPWSLLLPGRPLYSFLVIGADLQLIRGKDGSLELSGLGTRSSRLGKPNPTSSPEAEERFGLASLVGVGEVRLENSRLDVLDEQHAVRLHLSGINARLQVTGDTLAVSLESQLSKPASQLTYGVVEAVAQAKLDVQGQLQSARWHLAVSDLLLVHLHDQLPDHPLLPRQGRLSSEQWGEWSEVAGLSGKGTLELGNTWLSNGATDLLLDQFSTQFSWQGTAAPSWRMDLQDTRLRQGDLQLHWTGLTIARNPAQDLGLWLGADYLPLQDALPIARDFMALLDIAWPAAMPTGISGSLSGFDLVLAADGRNRSLSGEFRDIAVPAEGKRPGASGLSGSIYLESGQGRLNVHAPSLQIDWPGMFRGPLQLSLPECQAELVLGNAWQVALHGCQLFNEDVAAEGDVQVAASAGKPAVDINVEVNRLDVARLSPYWPDGVMPAAVTQWLRGNLHAGRVSSGRLQIHGDMDNWPFSNGAGRFEAWAQVEQGTLSFARGWPQLHGVTALAQFIGAGMLVKGQAGSFGGVPVEQAWARIGSFGSPLLEVGFQGSGDAASVMELLQQTPVLPGADYDLSSFRFGGEVKAEGGLELPLGSQPGSMRLDGSARINKGSFADHASGTELGGISGELDFTEQEVQAENLKARYKGKPASLDLQMGGDPEWGLQATLKGRFGVQDVLPDFVLAQQELVDLMHGSTEWLAQVLVPSKAAAPGQPVLLQVASGLQGVTLEFPAPLAKAEYELWPFTLRYPLTGDSRLLQLELNDELHVAAEIAAGGAPVAGSAARSQAGPEAGASEAPAAPGNAPAFATPEAKRAVIALGPATPHLTAAALQATDGLSLTGSVDSLDLDGWVDLVVDASKRGGGLGGLRMDTCAIQAEKLVFLDRWFDAASLEVAVSGNEIRAGFEAPDLDGQVTFTIGVNGQNSLNAEFDRLVLGKPISSGTDTDSNPADLPELHLYAESFRYAGLEMGETRIEAYPTAGGFHFEKIESNSDSLSVRASGDWMLVEGEPGQRSAFDIMMTAESLGELLQSLDISSSLQGGQTVLNFHAWWPGSPAAFALARLNGEIDFSVTRGQITNANTGTGKVLGLLSIQSLPRRLSLDFRDVFDSGFGFETATGTFQMENGTARTRDVKLVSSAANINLSGSTDLVNKQYDQQMTVMPGVGNTLPVIGALAAGPGGAAAGLALQGLLHEQLGKATQVHYSIKGSWDEPVIEPVVEPETEPGTPDGNGQESRNE